MHTPYALQLFTISSIELVEKGATCDDRHAYTGFDAPQEWLSPSRRPAKISDRPNPSRSTFRN
jgi:hypothetical protein